MKDLSDIPYDNNIKLASFDVTNMYINIPTDKFPNIIQSLCSINHINPTKQSEILHLCSVIINQSYFKFNDSYFIQKTGLAMDTPT